MAKSVICYSDEEITAYKRAKMQVLKDLRKLLVRGIPITVKIINKTLEKVPESGQGHLFFGREPAVWKKINAEKRKIKKDNEQFLKRCMMRSKL